MPISIPSEVNRRKAMIAVVKKLKAAFPKRQFIGNGAANASGNVRSLLADPNARAALGGGACVEELFLDGNGDLQSNPDPDHGKDMRLLTPSKRWIIEFADSGSDPSQSVATRKATEGFRLFFADPDHSFSGGGSIVAPSTFKVAYQDVAPDAGAGVDDLIIDPSEAENLDLSLGKPKRVWLYVCVGEVEDFRTNVFNKAQDANLVAQPNTDDPVGDVNVRFWDPAWTKILIAYMKSLEVQHAHLPLAGYFLDVMDSWMRDDSVWA
jgi:endo-alpha-1,4-polygalactosaminidase (GH114 family)